MVGSLSTRRISVTDAARNGLRRLGRRIDRLRLRVEDFRVWEHLRRTEQSLRETDTSHLSAAERERRRRQLDRLRAYWQRGEFPRNPTDGRIPYFVGADGTDCAVGNLLRKDGNGELTDRIAAVEPGLWVENVDADAAPGSHDAADADAAPGDHDAALANWIEGSGLSRDEVERIQPAYSVPVEFATTCGPVSCAVAAAFSGLFAASTMAGVEYLAYRFVGDLYPEKPTKRRVALAYLTVLVLVALPLVALLVYALFP